jgi:branched-chain amino acid transport system ATP-binding protein
MTGTDILSVEKLNGYYGKSHILQNVTFSVGRGQLVALLGRNGVGKTTTLKAISGALPRVDGKVVFDGKSVLGEPSHSIAAGGLSLVPEDRGIFASLSVLENLMLGRSRRASTSLEQVWEMFPSLQKRQKTGAGKLSGGEQQMLAIARALLTGPTLLLLDEPTEGLAPVIVDHLVEILRHLKASGLSILLVEQSFEVCTALADHLLILDTGTIVWQGAPATLTDDVKARHLTLEHA